jgi:hypothetical protein
VAKPVFTNECYVQFGNEQDDESSDYRPSSAVGDETDYRPSSAVGDETVNAGRWKVRKLCQRPRVWMYITADYIRSDVTMISYRL